MDKNELIIKEQQSILKQKNKKPIIFAILALIICLVSGLYIYASVPARQLQRHLDKQDYESAVLVYNNKIHGRLDEDTFYPIFQEHITTITDSWMQEELEYKEAAALLEIFEGIENPDVSKHATSKKVFIILEGENGLLHQKAEECYSAKDYIGTMDIIETINPAYSQAESAKDLYDICKETILAQVTNLSTIEAIENGIVLIDDCLAKVDEPAFVEKKQFLESELIIFKDIVSIIDNAEILYNNGDFKEAFESISSGIQKYPDRSQLIEAQEIFVQTYIATVALDVKTACESEDYKMALSILDTAMAEYSCEEFDLLKESVREQKSWLYKTYKNTKEKIQAMANALNSEDFDIEQATKNAGNYILKSGEKLILGDYSEENVTVLSMGANVFASITGLDTILDIRDLAYDIQHIGEEDYIVAQLAVDTIALIPIIGMVKYFKYTDEVADGVKTVSNVADQISDASKSAENMAEILATTKTADNLGEALDNAADVSKNADTVADTTQDVAKHYRHEKTINQDLKDKKHPISGIMFKSKKVEYSDGRLIEGVFPVFKSKFDFNLEPKYFKSDETVHFAKANEGLKEALENNKMLKYKFNKSQLADIEAGKTPNGYTWHHNEEEGLLQLVDRTIHNQTNHTGGMKLWGKGYRSNGE